MTTGTPLYSPLPAEPVDVLTALAAYGENQGRDRFPALPWTMEGIAGSLWCNLHTGTLSQVVEVANDSGGRPFPCIASEFGWAKDEPGLWWGDRYVIEGAPLSCAAGAAVSGT